VKRPWRSDPHTLAGAYALDALAEADQVSFERHLTGCEACRHETDGLREAAGRLAAATAVAPPPALRAAVLAEAARTRQSVPPAGRARRSPTDRRITMMLPPRLAVAVAGFAMLLALAVGALTVNTAHRLGLADARGNQIAVVLSAPDATMMRAHASDGATATVVMSHAEHSLVLTTAALPALPEGRAYEVWVMGAGWAHPAGLLPAPHDGMTAPIVVSELGAGDRIGVTVEPSSGSAHPTGPLVITLDLPA
jgi:hypothetical protein